MTSIDELRIALTVDDFDRALAVYRDALGLEQLEDWTSENGRVVLLDAGRATLELFDHAQAAYVDDLEVGRRVSGTVRLALRVARDWALHGWVLSWGPHVRVAAPPALAAEILAMLEDARERYVPKFDFEALPLVSPRGPRGGPAPVRPDGAGR